MRGLDPNWRDIPGYDGAYQISREGDVRTWRYRKDRRLKKPRLLSQYMKHQGKRSRRRYVKLTRPDGTTVEAPVLHLMVDVYLGGQRPGKVPYHKNGDLADHNINNIGFITRQELGRMTGGDSSRRPVAKVDRNGEIVEVYPSARLAGKANHMSYEAVLQRCHGKVKDPFAADGYNYVFDC